MSRLSKRDVGRRLDVLEHALSAKNAPSPPMPTDEATKLAGWLLLAAAWHAWGWRGASILPLARSKVQPDSDSAIDIAVSELSSIEIAAGRQAPAAPRLVELVCDADDALEASEPGAGYARADAARKALWAALSAKDWASTEAQGHDALRPGPSGADLAQGDHGRLPFALSCDCGPCGRSIVLVEPPACTMLGAVR